MINESSTLTPGAYRVSRPYSAATLPISKSWTFSWLNVEVDLEPPGGTFRAFALGGIETPPLRPAAFAFVSYGLVLVRVRVRVRVFSGRFDLSVRLGAGCKIRKPGGLQASKFHPTRGNRNRRFDGESEDWPYSTKLAARNVAVSNHVVLNRKP